MSSSRYSISCKRQNTMTRNIRAPLIMMSRPRNRRTGSLRTLGVWDQYRGNVVLGQVAGLPYLFCPLDEGHLESLTRDSSGQENLVTRSSAFSISSELVRLGGWSPPSLKERLSTSLSNGSITDYRSEPYMGDWRSVPWKVVRSTVEMKTEDLQSEPCQAASSFR